jgi:hypothetical protein
VEGRREGHWEEAEGADHHRGCRCRHRHLFERSELKSEIRKSEVGEQRVGGLGCQNVGGRLMTRGELE